MGLMAALEEARSPACSLRLCHGKQQAACETLWGKGHCSPAAAEAAAGAASGLGSLTAAPGDTGSEALVVTQVPFGAFQWTGTGPESPAVIPAPQCSFLCDLAAGDGAVDSMDTAVHCAQPWQLAAHILSAWLAARLAGQCSFAAHVAGRAPHWQLTVPRRKAHEHSCAVQQIVSKFRSCRIQGDDCSKFHLGTGG